jgi:hypothetical protein
LWRIAALVGLFVYTRKLLEGLQNSRSVDVQNFILHSLVSPPPKAQLLASQIDTPYSYEALLYVWGKPDVSEALFVGNQKLGISKKKTKSHHQTASIP